MIKFTAFFLLVCACGHVSAQSPANHVSQPIEWTSFNLYVAFSKRIALVNDGNFRFVQNFQSQQHQLRSGLEIVISKKLSVVPIGYSYIWNYRYGEQPAKYVNNEFRFWQQIQYKHKIGRVAIGHRLRIEERNIEKHDDPNKDGKIVNEGYTNEQFRLRYRLNSILPLTAVEGATKYYFLNVWDEVHYSHDYAGCHNIQYTNTPSQNRFFAGIGYQFSKSCSVQSGFLYQWLKKDDGVRSENNLGVLLQFNYGLALFKAAK